MSQMTITQQILRFNLAAGFVDLEIQPGLAPSPAR